MFPYYYFLIHILLYVFVLLEPFQKLFLQHLYYLCISPLVNISIILYNDLFDLHHH